jgi:hypothetical protein
MTHQFIEFQQYWQPIPHNNTIDDTSTKMTASCLNAHQTTNSGKEFSDRKSGDSHFCRENRREKKKCLSFENVRRKNAGRKKNRVRVDVTQLIDSG